MPSVIGVTAMFFICLAASLLPAAAATDKVFLEMAATIPEPIRNFIFCSLTAVVLVTFTSFFFIRKLRKMNRLLAAKNNEIEKAMTEQAELNAELSRQRDTIARELADSEKLYAILIESASDGISFYDSNEKIILANTAFYSLLDMTREEYNATDPEEFLHPDSKSYMSLKASALKESGSYLTEIR
ncbi:MAG: PAS domain S-box protein, partial [Bacteroidales bacterium]|nr:PAS domain S-box protein [Bacteroidales bacterium]